MRPLDPAGMELIAVQCVADAAGAPVENSERRLSLAERVMAIVADRDYYKMRHELVRDSDPQVDF